MSQTTSRSRLWVVAGGSVRMSVLVTVRGAAETNGAGAVRASRIAARPSCREAHRSSGSRSRAHRRSVTVFPPSDLLRQGEVDPIDGAMRPASPLLRRMDLVG